MNRAIKIFLLLFLPISLISQTLEEQLSGLNDKLESLKQEQQNLLEKVEGLKLLKIQQDLKAVGLPGTEYVEHSAMILEYAEKHEQAKWVAHIVLSDIITGAVFRSNDFREDPKVKTGTAVEVDYFLKTMKADSTYEYDGFGFDRGHLAPSADFRWSSKALSESYFYSNMSPQRPEFNRESWAEVERLIRGYLYEHPTTQLYVVTGPVLKDDLPVVKRSVNKVSIPEQYFKVVLDLDAGKAIAFLMPNKKIENSIDQYVVSVDAVEKLTGLDFFNAIEKEESIESSIDKKHWIPEIAKGDVEPIYAPSLPRDHYNTIQAKQHIGKNKEVTICGKVVSTRYSRSGNLWMNLDKQFPNQVFSVFIRKKDLSNFSYDPQEYLEGRVIKIKGKVQDFNGVPTINLSREELVGFLGEGE